MLRVWSFAIFYDGKMFIFNKSSEKIRNYDNILKNWFENGSGNLKKNIHLFTLLIEV